MTPYETELAKVFKKDNDKFELDDKSYYLKRYLKELGDMDITTLINQGLLTLDLNLLQGVINGGESPNLNQYQGQVKNGMAHGIGRLVSQQNGIYEGQFVNGVPKGFGNAID